MATAASLKRLIVSGLAIEYVDEGKGRVALMLHGWGSNYRAFNPLAEGLKDEYRVVRLNLPGFGGSQVPPLTWGTRDYAMFVQAFCEKLGLEPQVLMGHSFGGQTAVYLVGTSMLEPKRLVLLAASAIRPIADIRQRIFRILAKTGKATVGRTALADRARRKLYAAAGTEDYLQSGKMQRVYRRIVGEDQSDTAAKITCPTLLVWGDVDRDTPIERGRLLHRLIGGSEFVEIKAAGHLLMQDKPAEVTAAVEAFLAR